MKLSTDDITRAIKISGELQNYFDNHPSTQNLKLKDAYGILIKKNLVETDRNTGKFRAFLMKLKNTQGLDLIPQCRVDVVNGKVTKWSFESAPGKTMKQRNLVPLSQVNRAKTLNIDKMKEEIESLPKKEPAECNAKDKGMLEKYPRAFEQWTKNEEELLMKASEEITDSFKLSEIFGRQPSAIAKRLDQLKVVS